MSYRPQFTKYEFPTEPRSTTNLILRQLGIFAILGGIVFFFYVMGFWDELIVETKKLFSSPKPKPKPLDEHPPDTSEAAVAIESKKER